MIETPKGKIEHNFPEVEGENVQTISPVEQPKVDMYDMMKGKIAHNFPMLEEENFETISPVKQPKVDMYDMIYRKSLKLLEV